jgi:hypothetical protein
MKFKQFLKENYKANQKIIITLKGTPLKVQGVTVEKFSRDVEMRNRNLPTDGRVKDAYDVDLITKQNFNFYKQDIHITPDDVKAIDSGKTRNIQAVTNNMVVADFSDSDIKNIIKPYIDNIKVEQKIDNASWSDYVKISKTIKFDGEIR